MVLHWFSFQCNRVPDERRYALPLKSIYMRQIDQMVGLIWSALPHVVSIWNRTPNNWTPGQAETQPEVEEDGSLAIHDGVGISFQLPAHIW